MRKHFTKAYIEEALLELLKKYPLSQISVSDVTNKAGVSRASFYRNYLDLNQVLEEYVERIFNKEIIAEAQNTANMRSSICSILRHLYNNRGVLKLLYKNALLLNMQKVIYQTTYDEINKLNVFNNKYQPYFFAGATAGFIEGWIINDFAESPEEMTELFIKSLHGYLDVI